MDYIFAINEALTKKNLAPRTRTAYLTYLRPYLEYLSSAGITPEKASWQDMINFISFIQSERDLSDRTVNMIISYLQFFQVYVVHKEWHASQIPFRKFDTFLPYVPSDGVIRSILAASPDGKFYLITAMLYATGMRLDELCHLKCADIYHTSGKIHIRRSKNHTDRYIPLPESIWKLILSYWNSLPSNLRPRDWLFTQQTRLDHPMDKQRYQRQLIQIRERLHLDGRLSAHSFRHAYASRCYANGMDLITLKAYLGHKSINSTCIYIQLAASGKSGYVSPFDQLINGEDSHA